MIQWIVGRQTSRETRDKQGRLAGESEWKVSGLGREMIEIHVKAAEISEIGRSFLGGGKLIDRLDFELLSPVRERSMESVGEEIKGSGRWINHIISLLVAI